VPGGPADKAGVKPGDLVISINGEKINDYGDIAAIATKAHVGAQYTLVILRNREYNGSIYGEDNSKPVWSDQSLTATAMTKSSIPYYKEYGFRGFPWGTSIKEVTHKEGSAKVQHSDAILYEGVLANMPCEYGFFFVDDALYRGTYIIANRHSTLDGYWSDFENLQTLLSDKYGTPNDAASVANWHTIRAQQWTTQGESIVLLLDNEDGYSVSVIYTSNILAKKAIAANDKLQRQGL
jgi:membrane-associated protease RseP (regulator of RpoE activity)